MQKINQNEKGFYMILKQQINNLYKNIIVIYQFIKENTQNQLKLKKIIQRAQKIEFLNNVMDEDKIGVKNLGYLNLFIMLNVTVFGLWRFSYKEYRNMKNFGIFCVLLGYFGYTFGIMWQDENFLNKISTKQDAYKNQIKYLFRKECLENLSVLKRIERKRQTFQKLNQEFEQFNIIKLNNNKIINLL